MSTKNSSANNTLFSKERIETLIRGVKQAKDATKPSGKERTLLNHYEILTAGNLENFIKRKTSDGECYVDTVRLGFISRTCSNNNATLTYIFCLGDSGQTLHLDQYLSNPIWYIKVIFDSCNGLI
jgi:hypothetical protein